MLFRPVAWPTSVTVSFSVFYVPVCLFFGGFYLSLFDMSDFLFLFFQVSRLTCMYSCMASVIASTDMSLLLIFFFSS